MAAKKKTTKKLTKSKKLETTKAPAVDAFIWSAGRR
jgi:hypothetical protein